MKDKALNIKISKELHEQIKKEADKKCISMASVVRIILVEYFEKHLNKK